MDQHRHGAGTGVLRRDGEGQAAGNLLHPLAACGQGECDRLPHLLGRYADVAARAGQGIQRLTGNRRIGDGRGDGKGSVGLALDLVHRRGRDGHLRLGHIAGDLRLDHDGLALVFHRLLHQLVALRSAHNGACCAVLGGRLRRSGVRGCGRRKAYAVGGCQRYLDLDCGRVVVGIIIGLENYVIALSSNNHGFRIFPDKGAT